MANIDTLKTAGLISQTAAFNAADTAIINSLTADEVSALISVSGKLTASFVSNNIGSAAVPAGSPAKTIGIVF
jgi:hypothetical protein